MQPEFAIEREEAVGDPVDSQRSPRAASSGAAPLARRTRWTGASARRRLLERAQRGLDRVAVRAHPRPPRIRSSHRAVRNARRSVHAQTLERGLGRAPGARRAAAQLRKRRQELCLRTRGSRGRAAELRRFIMGIDRARCGSGKVAMVRSVTARSPDPFSTASTRARVVPMQKEMETAAARKHVLISHAGPEAYAPMTA
jgi:hypothetical protein